MYEAGSYARQPIEAESTTMSIRSLMVPYQYPYVPSAPTHYSDIAYVQKQVPHIRNSPSPALSGLQSRQPYLDFGWHSVDRQQAYPAVEMVESFEDSEGERIPQLRARKGQEKQQSIANNYKYGGLGPSYVGTEQWLQQKQRIDKINEFSQKIRVMNSKRIGKMLRRGN